MRKFILPFALIAFFSSQLLAQSDEQLGMAIKIYNSLQIEREKDLPNYDSILEASEEAEALLLQTYQEGNADEKKTAYYFFALLAQMKAEVLSTTINMEDSELKALLFSVKENFDNLNESEFPIRYVLDGKNFTVKYDNFVATRQVYFAQIALLYFNEKNQENTRKYAKKALACNDQSFPYLDYGMHYYLFFMAQNDGESQEYARKMVTDYAHLSQESLDAINLEGNGKPLMEKALKTLSEVNMSGYECLSMAKELGIHGDLDEDAAKYYLRAYEKNISLKLHEHWVVLDFFVKIGNKTNGLKIATRVEKSVSMTDCESLEKLSAYFKKFGDAAKSAAYASTAQKCSAEAQKRAIEEEKRRQKAVRKANRHKAYLGIYPLRLVQRPQYIDLGGVLNIPVKHSYIELSYMKARNDQDYLIMERLQNKDGVNDISNPHWDGHYAHVAWKKQAGKNDGSYAGILLNYNLRNFQPQLTDVFQRNTTETVATAVSLKPQLKSYGFMLNFGHIALKNTLGMDMYYGIGTNYNKFDLKNTQFDRINYQYSNGFLENRKENFWGFQIRLGVTVGLGI